MLKELLAVKTSPALSSQEPINIPPSDTFPMLPICNLDEFDGMEAMLEDADFYRSLVSYCLLPYLL
jgi:hypothetical protein